MSDSPAPLLALTWARVLEFVREPGAIFWVFGFPVLMAVVLGLAFRSSPQEATPVAVVESASASEWARRALERSPDIVARVLPESEAAQALRTGKVDLVVEATFDSSAKDLADAAVEATYAVSYRYDPTRPQSRSARLLADDVLQRAAGRRDPVSSRVQEVVEPGARYIDFLIPGLIGLNLMGSSMFGLGFVVVFMRSRKLLKRFAATPMRRSDFLLSLMFSRLIFLFLEVGLLVAFGWLVFGVAVRGSLLDLVLVALLSSLSFTGIALLVAARTKTVEVASGLMNLVMIPMWLCSGSFFSYARFPEFLHPAIRALPLTATNDALRSIFNEGAPLSANWIELAVTAGWGLVSFAAALRIFRWQ